MEMRQIKYFMEVTKEEHVNGLFVLPIFFVPVFGTRVLMSNL
ncbi:hypothetical protein [Domibacillus aminovorans]|nr:hypothetical protein [Domibacillus aminovorans]